MCFGNGVVLSGLDSTGEARHVGRLRGGARDRHAQKHRNHRSCGSVRPGPPTRCPYRSVLLFFASLRVSSRAPRASREPADSPTAPRQPHAPQFARSPRRSRRPAKAREEQQPQEWWFACCCGRDEGPLCADISSAARNTRRSFRTCPTKSTCSTPHDGTTHLISGQVSN